MATSLPTKGNSFHPSAARERLLELASFRITYVAIVAFVFLYVFSVGTAESLLQRHFLQQVEATTQIEPGEGSLVVQIRRQVSAAVNTSPWVRIGGVQVIAVVLGADGTAVYAAGLPLAPPVESGPEAWAREMELTLPMAADVTAAVPHNSLLANVILVGYATLLLTALYVYQNKVAQRQEAQFTTAVHSRDDVAARAERIEGELSQVQGRLSAVDVAEHEHAVEIGSLRVERRELTEKLHAVEQRERELTRDATAGFEDLDSERQALEELLDEALADLQNKDDEIGRLETSLRRASKDAAAAGSARTREADHLARRLRTLYKNLEVDDRALSDLVALRDESMKLRAEEVCKRLSDDVETAGARRKVGGLPPGIPVFEIGFAGKGRIYYTHGTQRRIRILSVGAKNSQKKDLEYLSRIVTQ